MLQDVMTRFSTATADGSPGGYSVTRAPLAAFGLNGLIVVAAFASIGFDSGSFNAGGVSMLTLDACVQPYSGRGLDVLPEGSRAEDIRVVDTQVPLQVNPPDIITIAGDSYAVFHAEGPVNFMDGSIRYTSYAARQKVPG